MNGLKNSKAFHLVSFFGHQDNTNTRSTLARPLQRKMDQNMKSSSHATITGSFVHSYVLGRLARKASRLRELVFMAHQTTVQ